MRRRSNARSRSRDFVASFTWQGIEYLRRVAIFRSMEVHMKVFGHPWSINTRKTLMTFAEKGAHAELVVVMLPKGEHKTKEHLARHPFGKVPVLFDGEIVVYETRAI